MITSECKVVLLSNVGNSRENQEDNALFNDKFFSNEDIETMSKTRRTYLENYSPDAKNGFLVAVCDGMGGHDFGEVASYLTAEYLSDNYRSVIDSSLIGENAISRDIKMANDFVLSKSRGDSNLKNIGATLCGVVGKNSCFYGFNVGDSRLYRYVAGKLEQLSVDHTEGQRLVNLKLLTKEECAKFPRRKTLYKYIGHSVELCADVFPIKQCVSGTTLLICSDGLTDCVSDEKIESVLKTADSVEQKGKALMEEALQCNAGYGDNITIILIEF